MSNVRAFLRLARAYPWLFIASCLYVLVPSLLMLYALKEALK
jgi:hypothetical protein